MAKCGLLFNSFIVLLFMVIWSYIVLVHNPSGSHDPPVCEANVDDSNMYFCGILMSVCHRLVRGGHSSF